MRGEIASSESIVQGRHLPRGFDEGCDVVVVGSGAGGAVVAAHLAEAGLRVLVLEEGPHYQPEEYGSFRPTESMRRMWREAGAFTALGLGQTPIIGLTVGRCVGGSSVLTGGVCFRIPSEVHEGWANELGLPELSEKSLETAYEDVERRVGVKEVPAEARSRSTQKFVDGAAKLGIPMRPLRRNTHECEGNGRCNFGCPKQAKLSVDRTYLPSAIEHGARIVADALVERILVEGGRAIGVEGRLLGGRLGAPSHRFRIRARTVVVACGTLHTPLLLMASGIRHAELGRGITLHPALRISAYFDEALNGWDGALQSVYSHHYAQEGIALTGVYVPPNLLAAALPGIGAEHKRYVERIPNLGVFGAMVHDDGGGQVRQHPFGAREPVLTYRMAPRDLVRLRHSITVLCELAFAAGAREIYPPIFGLPPIRSMDEARRIEEMPLDARRIECIASHPLGSARMGNEPRRGVTSPSGQVYGVEGLFVADGSVLPTSIGVNSQVPIMTMATRIAWGLRERA